MNPLSSKSFSEASQYLSPHQFALINDVDTILQRIKDFDHINDYSFLVSPVSKAYEGFLKEFFLKIGIIDQHSYNSDRFRVGKTLNPTLRYKRFSIFQKLSELDDRGEELAETLWNAWKFGRNEIFHYFPNKLKNLTRLEAEERISLVLNAITSSGKFLHEHQQQVDINLL